MVNINIVIRYMAVIATGTRAKAALVIVGLENLCLPVSILRHPFVFSCVYNRTASMVAGCSYMQCMSFKSITTVLPY